MDAQIGYEQLRYAVWTVSYSNQIPSGYAQNRIWADSLNEPLVLRVCPSLWPWVWAVTTVMLDLANTTRILQSDAIKNLLNFHKEPFIILYILVL